MLVLSLASETVYMLVSWIDTMIDQYVHRQYGGS